MAISNISNLPISASFQNLVQTSGSVIGTATGSQIDSLDITASNAVFATSANTATSASHATQADNATSASFATTASYALRVDPVETGSLLQTASISDATITFEKADASTFDLTVNNVASATSASHAVQADSALAADTATSASHAVQADNATTADSVTSASYAATATSASHADLADLATLATNATYADNTIAYGKNLLGSEIAKGTPLYFTASGTSGNIVGVYPADASNASRRPAGGIAGETIAIGAEGTVLLDGFINGVDTTLFNSGDKIYLGAGGGFTNVAPTGSTNLVQFLGYVEKKAANGSGVIQMSGESRQVPNIAQNNVWVGDANGVAQPTNVNTLSVATASLALDVDTSANLNITSISASSANFVSASIGYLESITGSAKIIGDAFIILNADSPTERYAGLKVYDSGSLQTGSLVYDSVDDHWEYESTAEGYAAGFISGPTGSIGGTTNWPTQNTIVKGLGSNHIGDSNITDDGSKVAINSNSEITGSLTVTSTITGTLSGNASTATSASHAVQADSALTAISASHALQADNATTADSATTATTANTASYVAAANVDGTVATATSASHALIADTATSSSHAVQADSALAADTATSASHAINADSALTATSASYATSASIADFEKNLNANSASVQIWQGNQTEYDLISGSASDDVLYFVI